MNEQDERKEDEVIHEFELKGTKYISAKRASDIANVTQRHITKLIGKGILKGVHVGGEKIYFVTTASFENYLENIRKNA